MRFSLVVRAGGGSARSDGTPTRRASRYISQPRQKPKTALSRAAPSAKPVATRPTTVAPARKPTRPTIAKAKPTAWANRGGAGSSSCAGRAEPRPDQRRNSQAYGVRWTPSQAATANSERLDAEQHGGEQAGGEQQHGGEDDGGEGSRELRAARVDQARCRRLDVASVQAGSWEGPVVRISRVSDSTIARLCLLGSADIRHSDERTRQWSTARRLVSQVDDMPANVGGRSVHA